MLTKTNKTPTARDINVANSVDQVDLPYGWLDKVLELEHDDVAVVVGEIVNRAQISGVAIRKARSNLQSFSTEKWSELAPSFGLSGDPSPLRFQSFSVPTFNLPPSFHANAFQVAWRNQDVYQERPEQDMEAARLRVFDAYLVPIVGLFQGRIIDKPDHPIGLNKHSWGGEVEHELVMIGGVLFFIIEMRPFLLRKDNIAQLLLGLLSAAEANEGEDFQGLRVYGLLTDLASFQFYSFDPTTRKFAFDEQIYVNLNREALFADMIYVTNKVFSIVLFAYIEGVTAMTRKSHDRPPSSSGSPHLPCNCGHPNSSTSSDCVGSCKPITQWDLALDLAQQCLTKFQAPVSSVEDIDKNSCEAIELLMKSVLSVPRFSHFSGEKDLLTSVQLNELAYHIVQATHEALLKRMKMSLD